MNMEIEIANDGEPMIKVSEPTQLDRIELMLTELLEGKRQIERFAEEIQGKGMLGMMSALKGFGG